jgi:hypothetical protein
MFSWMSLFLFYRCGVATARPKGNDDFQLMQQFFDNLPSPNCEMVFDPLKLFLPFLAPLYLPSGFSIDPAHHFAREIGGFLSGLQDLAFCNEQLKKTVLAILRRVRNPYLMHREAVLIGCGTIDHDMDICLVFETHRICTNISRMQPILTFVKDCNCYLDKVGNRVFRVTGVVTEAREICQPSGGPLRLLRNATDVDPERDNRQEHSSRPAGNAIKLEEAMRPVGIKYLFSATLTI